MSRRIEVCVLDVNETLSDLSALAPRFDDVGLVAADVTGWFTGVLRDGFTLTLLGQRPVFRDLAAAGLQTLLSSRGLAAGTDPLQHVLSGLSALPLHPDVVPGLRALHAQGVGLVPLTNGALAMSEAMFGDAGVLDLFAHRLSVEEVGPWKPHPAPYQHALRTARVQAGAALMVAVHPWDLAGAAAVGLSTGWVDRTGRTEWPGCFSQPDLTAHGLDGLADQLAA